MMHESVHDYNPNDLCAVHSCVCPTCRSGKGLSKSLLNTTFGKVITTAASITLHNLAFQNTLMAQARQSIVDQHFPEYLKMFFFRYYNGHANYPWVCILSLSEQKTPEIR